MSEIKKYHLDKDDYSKLHFQIHEAAAYCERNIEHCYKAHQHSFYQLIWFKTAGQHYVDYEIIKHPANTLFFLNKKQVHYFCEQCENEGFLFHFDEIFLHREDSDSDNWLQYKLFNELGAPYIHLGEKEIPDVSYLTRLLQREITQQAYNYRKQIFHLFQALLLKVERLKQQQQKLEEKLDHDFILAMEFKRLVEAHLHEFLSVHTYGDLLGISSKKLTTLSKRFLGDTPSHVVNKRKILEAKRLLSNLKISIKEVGFSLGFNQATYFTKYFKKHTGITPKEFIKQLP